MALTGHEVAGAADGGWRRIRAFHDLRRRRMFVGEPVGGTSSAADLRGVVFLRAARDADRSRQLRERRRILVGDVVSARGQTIGTAGTFAPLPGMRSPN